jgi:hypothetical protein
MAIKSPLERGKILAKFISNYPKETWLTWDQAYGVLKDYDTALEIEDDPEFYEQLFRIRQGIMEKLEARALELEKGDEWQGIKEVHNARLTLRHFIHASSDKEINALYRDATPEQLAALDYLTKRGGLDPDRLNDRSHKGKPQRFWQWLMRSQ